MPYAVNWDTVQHIQEAVEVLDGLWKVTKQGAHCEIAGYDRLLCVGDLTWKDYELTVEITPDSLFGWISIGMRWNGQKGSGSRPYKGWRNSGASGWYVMHQEDRKSTRLNSSH